MTSQEASEKAQEFSLAANRAMYHHNLAMQAYAVAIARYDWTLAEKEREVCVDYLRAYLDAIAGVQKVSEEIGK